MNVRFAEIVRVIMQPQRMAATISWARKYAGRPDELLEFRDDMIAEIADAVSVELTERNLQRLHTPETDSPAAFQEVLLGRRALCAPHFGACVHHLSRMFLHRIQFVDAKSTQRPDG